MWLFMNNAFVSIVADRTNPDRVLVRGRLKGDVERALGKTLRRAKVTRTPHADYLYRATITRRQLADRMLELVDGISYPNFKGSIPATAAHAGRSHAYHRVWDVMMDAQRAAEPKSGGIHGMASVEDYR